MQKAHPPNMRLEQDAGDHCPQTADSPCGARLDRGQFVYRRRVGAEMHVAELYAFGWEAVGRRRFAYLDSVGAESACAAAPHESLIRTCDGLGVSSYVCPYPRMWMAPCLLRIRLPSQTGKAYVAPHRGGFSSPARESRISIRYLAALRANEQIKVRSLPPLAHSL